MTAQFILTEDDHLTFQLYQLSKSEQLKKTRNRGRVPVLVLLLLALFFSIKSNPVLAVIYACVGIIFYFFLPHFTKWHYARQMRVSVREQFSKMIENPVQIELTDETIFKKMGSVESRTLLADIETIDELPTIVIIEFKSGHNTTLPRHQNSNTDSVIAKLKEMASGLGAKYREKTDWRWK